MPDSDGVLMYENLHIYIDFDWVQYVEDSNNYLYEVDRIIRIAYQHKASVFYSKNQVQYFAKNCSDWDESFSQSEANKLALILEDAIGRYGDCYFFDVCFSRENTSLHYKDNTAISIIDSYSMNALISLNKYNEYTSLLSIKSATNFEKVDFMVVNNISSLLQWIQDKSTLRRFNLSDKHGENGRGNWAGESVLLCNRNNAQELLNTAIPDFTKKEKQLFNFDVNYQTFIEFFYEGNNPQNQWHGFHIKQDEWNKRIPLSILKHFGK